MVEAFPSISSIFLVRSEGGGHIIARAEGEQKLKVAVGSDEVLRMVYPVPTSGISALWAIVVICSSVWAMVLPFPSSWVVIVSMAPVPLVQIWRGNWTKEGHELGRLLGGHVPDFVENEAGERLQSG